MRRRYWILAGIGAMLTARTVAYAQTSVQVEIRDRGMVPNVIAAKKGSEVKIHIVNHGGKQHNFVIPEFYIFTQNLNPNEDVNVAFTPDKTGHFDFYSDTGGKPEQGLTGKLHVSS